MDLATVLEIQKKVAGASHGEPVGIPAAQLFELCEFVRSSLIANQEGRPNVDPWPNLPTAERDYTFGQLWVLGSQYADLLDAAMPVYPETATIRELKRTACGEPPESLRAIVILWSKALLILLERSGQLAVTELPGGGVVSSFSPFDKCSECGKMKLQPSVAYGIAPEAVCRC